MGHEALVCSWLELREGSQPIGMPVRYFLEDRTVLIAFMQPGASGS